MSNLYHQKLNAINAEAEAQKIDLENKAYYSHREVRQLKTDGWMKLLMRIVIGLFLAGMSRLF